MKKTLSIILALCVVMSLAVITVSAKSYTDVPATHWAKANIDKWTDNNVMVGKTDTVFGVNDYMIRAEVAEVLNNLLRKKNVSTSVLSKYSDVDATSSYAQAIANCSEYGLVTGYEDGTFRPTENVTREQLVAIMGRALDLRSTGNEASRYKDASKISSWALPFVSGLTKDGRLIGYPDGEVKPTRFISKCEVAKLLSNIVDVYITTPGTYNVSPDQLVFIATEGDVKLEGGNPETVVVSRQATVTVPTGTKVVNNTNSAIAINNTNYADQGSIIAPAPADTTGTVSGGTSAGGGGVRPNTYKLTFSIEGPGVDGAKTKREKTINYVSSTAKLTNTLLFSAFDHDALEAAYDGTGFYFLIVSKAKDAYTVGGTTWTTFVNNFSPKASGDSVAKTAFSNDSEVSALTEGTTYTLSFTQPAGTYDGHTTTVGGTYIFTVTLSK